ncbi:penicillin-binding transpeptidase domain-containing protein [Aquibacillus kalidii]|uniref:penicillin-binding transpeptidase domain-containing protein n=1 Tax=Aquibacillus kalidii TaxID=2762597 RepID=UPI001648319F|nr:penicillin-binding transpeptidase domain-containing protein [Aquibacillus kalidii]
MQKLIKLLSLLILVTILASCSKEEVKPEDRLKEYVSNWNEEKFSEMYQMVSASTKEHYPTEEYIDRYQKIYEDLEVSNLKIDYEIPEQKEKESKEEEEATSASFPITVSMDTVAGPITFDYNIRLVQEVIDKEKEEKNWFVEWNPGLIFPEIKNGGEITFQSTQPTRGEIYDRNHNGLAVNAVVYELGVVPEQFAEDPEKEKQQIAEVLDMDVEAIDKAMNASWVKPNYFVPLKVMPSLTEAEAAKLNEDIGPLTYQNTTGRLYPYGKATAHMVGYIGKMTAERLEKLDQTRYSANDMIGIRGLEELFEDRLKGHKGLKIVVEKEDEEPVTLAETEVQHGENITLTIDAELQKTIYESFNGDAGTASAIHPKTGETLALVSSPAFDPNQLTYGINQEDWDALQDDEKQPLINRFAATFAPGSTIKPITAAIGLKNGSIKPNEGIEIEGLTWKVDGYSVRRVSESNGPVDLTDALIRSDNIYFAKQAVEMGGETLAKGLKDFGFNEEFPFTYPLEQSTLSSSGELDRKTLLADTGYGQGEMQMNILHLAVSYTPFLNDGSMIKPTLEITEETSQVWKDDLISSENIAVIKDALRKVVTDPKGTGRGANISGIEISGKTGTAELKASQDEENGQENGWFVSYPSQEDILISMMVEHVEDKPHGSAYVVEKMADIYEKIR